MITHELVVRIQRDANGINNQQVICFDKNGNTTFFNKDIDTKTRQWFEAQANNPLYEFHSSKHTSPSGLGSIRVRRYTWAEKTLSGNRLECGAAQDACQECFFQVSCEDYQ